MARARGESGGIDLETPLGAGRLQPAHRYQQAAVPALEALVLEAKAIRPRRGVEGAHGLGHLRQTRAQAPAAGEADHEHRPVAEHGHARRGSHGRHSLCRGTKKSLGSAPNGCYTIAPIAGRRFRPMLRRVRCGTARSITITTIPIACLAVLLSCGGEPTHRLSLLRLRLLRNRRFRSAALLCREWGLTIRASAI